jgi:signal peptidase I
VDKHLTYSFGEQKKRRQQIRLVLLSIAAFFIVYVCFTSFVFSMRVVLSNSMQPGIHAKDRFIFSSYMLYKPDLQRGSIVLTDMGQEDTRGILIKFFDGFVRFWTFQHTGINKREELLYLKRVIALPGDEVSMTNFVIRIKKKESPYRVTEFEASELHYEVIIPQVPALWDESLPFSGNMESILLGEDEYFLLSDDRNNTNDSRMWGAVPLKRIAGKALFRYWPITRIGKP